MFVSIGHNTKNQFEALTLIEFSVESWNHQVLALKLDEMQLESNPSLLARKQKL